MGLTRRSLLSGIAAIAPATAAGNDAAVVLEKLLPLLANEYVDSAMGATTSAALMDRASKSDWARSSGEPLAAAITADLQSISGDLHFRVLYRRSAASTPIGPLPSPLDGEPVASDQERDELLAHSAFAHVEMINQRIALLTVDGFPYPWAEVRARYADLFRRCENCSALLIDLRKNEGGDPRSTCYAASFLFSRPSFTINQLVWRSGRTMDFATASDVEGPKFDEQKPVYILIGGATFSAGEEFAYDLQATRRARIVGQRSRGGAHLNPGYHLGGGYIAFIPVARALNPVTRQNWQGTGVTPNVTTPRGTELVVARALLEAELKV